MATNLNINQELLEEALKIGGQKTKKSTVNKALKEFIEKRKANRNNLYVRKYCLRTRT